MSYFSENREDEVEQRANQTVKKVITVENDRLDNLPTEERLKLLREIEEMGDWRGLYEDMYLTFFEDEHVEVRRLAASAFWDFPEEKFAGRLIKGAKNDDDVNVRAECCSSLGRYIYEGFVTEDITENCFEKVRDFLLEVAADPDQPEVVRCRAVESLSFDTSEEIVDLIAATYEQGSIQSKSSALFAMGRSQLEQFHPFILEEMKSGIRRLRIQAVCAAREGYVKDATPALCEFAAGTDREVRLLAISALPFARGEGAVEALEACSMDRDLEVVEAAGKALDDFFGLEDEQLSETDAVDVRLGKISDIPILDSSRLGQHIMSAAAEEVAAEVKPLAKVDSEDDEDDEEEEEEVPVEAGDAVVAIPEEEDAEEEELEEAGEDDF